MLYGGLCVCVVGDSYASLVLALYAVIESTVLVWNWAIKSTMIIYPCGVVVLNYLEILSVVSSNTTPRCLNRYVCIARNTNDLA